MLRAHGNDHWLQQTTENDYTATMSKKSFSARENITSNELYPLFYCSSSHMNGESNDTKREIKLLLHRFLSVMNGNRFISIEKWC